MKFIFLIYFGINILFHLFLIFFIMIIDKKGINLNLFFKRDYKEKTLQEWIFPYFILLFLNLFMYLMACNL